MSTPKESPQSGGTSRTILGISIGLLAALCLVVILIPICVIAVLALLGPSIGNVFSNIILGI